MFGRILGKIIALPVRIVNAPLRVLNKTIEKIGDFPPDRTLDISDPGESVAKSIEETVEGALDE